MKRFIAKSITSLALLVMLLVAVSSPAFAATPDAACPGSNTSKGQVLSGIGEAGATDCSGSGVTSLAYSVVNILSIVVGIAAIIMIIIAGLKYVTSNGDANSVSSAKTTLIYALIGVFIAAVAQVLVHLVLTATNKT